MIHIQTRSNLNLNLNISLDKYGKNICQNLCVNIEQHSRVAIIGRNGVGKSTLLQHLLRSYISSNSYTVAYCSQNNKFYPHLYPQNIYNFICEKIAAADVNMYMKAFNIPEHEICNLSGGEAQIVYVLASLIQNADIIMLDEPTTHLDWVNSHAVLNLCIHRSINYPSIVLAVMHDIHNLHRYFTHVLYLKGNGDYVYIPISEYCVDNL
jgi:ATP-binding cassette subfamily F protein 3